MMGYTPTFEKTIFSQIDEKESRYYQQILSFIPLRGPHLVSLSSFLKDAGESIAILNDVSPVDKDFLTKINDNYSQFRLLEGPKFWGKNIYQLLLNAESETELSDRYELILNSKQYDTWRDTVKALYLEIIKAKNDFATSNMGLVTSVVKKMRFSSNLNIAFEDLLQEGYFGLMRAIEKFDYTKNLKFSTYAVWWIRHFVQRYVYDKSAFIRMPTHANEVRVKVDSFKQQFLERHARSPSKQEVIKGTGLSELTLDTIVDPIKISSLDAKNEEKKISAYELLADRDILSPLDKLISFETGEVIKKALAQLSEKEKRVILQRFGFESEEKSLNEIGNELNLSREGARQIQLRALAKMRELFDKEVV